MAFPASGFEQAYRNSIKDVAKFLNEKHSEGYLIINVSNRKYDYINFNNKVNEYAWEDHQSPTLDVLFQISYDAYTFLLSKNVITCFHCNHGKGRTGTAIICLILYTGFYRSVKQAIDFYNKRRFNKATYGVSQPCQLRYIQYFSDLIKRVENKEDPINGRIVAFRLAEFVFEGLDNSYSVNISSTRLMSSRLVMVDVNSKIDSQSPLIGDIYIEVVKKKWNGNKVIARANINLNFLQFNQKTQMYSWTMKGEEVRVSKSHDTNFYIVFCFKQFCKCHRESASDCLCEQDRIVEQKQWVKALDLARQSHQITIEEACKVLFSPYEILGSCSLEKQLPQSEKDKIN